MKLAVHFIEPDGAMNTHIDDLPCAAVDALYDLITGLADSRAADPVRVVLVIPRAGLDPRLLARMVPAGAVAEIRAAARSPLCEHEGDRDA